MEYMDLGSLDHICKVIGGKLPEPVAAKVALGVRWNCCFFFNLQKHFYWRGIRYAKDSTICI